MQKIKIFIFNKIIGLFLLAIFCFSSISLLSRTLEDPYFGNINSVNDIGNYFGVFGSYFAGTAYTFFGNISYIIPFFFLITGFRKTIGIRTNFLLIRLFSFVISLCLFSLILKFWLNQGGILGSFLLNIINFHFEDYLANKVIFLFLFVLFIFISIFLLFYSLSLNLRITSLLLSPFIKILVFILRFFKLSYLLAFVKTIFNLRKKLKIKSTNYKQNINHNNNIKKEPTLLADKVKNMGLGLINDGKRLSKTSINEYIIPSLSLLTTLPKKNYYSKEIEKHNEINARKLESILEDFGVIGKINNFKTGPIITIFEFQPSPGVKTSKVVGLATDIARSMSSMSARISSQPGKNSIGIEIPNDKKQDVYLGDLLNDEKFEQSRKGLILALGKSISGEKVYTDLERMPHLLIAGTTGSGKSVGINSMILSLLFRFKPSECKLILIDPKVLELSIYENIPHLLTPVVTDPKKLFLHLNGLFVKWKTDIV